MSRIRKLKKEKGQSLVETALVLPILMLILVGILEFGRILGAWMVITHASREGARIASLGGTNTQIEERVDTVSDALNLANISVDINPAGPYDRGDMVTVTVTYQIDSIIPLLSSVIGDTIEMDAETTMRVE